MAAGDNEAAKAKYEQAMKLRAQRHGRTSLAAARSYCDMALWAHGEGDTVAAEQYLRDALAIREERLGPGHEETVTVMYNLALLLHETDRHGAAEVLMRDVVRLRKRGLGKYHPKVAKSITFLAEILAAMQTLDDAAEARQLFASAKSIAVRACGADHPLVAQILEHMAALVEPEDALPMLTHALRIRRDHSRFGPPSAEHVQRLLTKLRAVRDQKSAVIMRTGSGSTVIALPSHYAPPKVCHVFGLPPVEDPPPRRTPSLFRQALQAAVGDGSPETAADEDDDDSGESGDGKGESCEISSPDPSPLVVSLFSDAELSTLPDIESRNASAAVLDGRSAENGEGVEVKKKSKSKSKGKSKGKGKGKGKNKGKNKGKSKGKSKEKSKGKGKSKGKSKNKGKNKGKSKTDPPAPDAMEDSVDQSAMYKGKSEASVQSVVLT
ncbi:TPR repeat-containing protein [Thecamonas trahens ATCC 50062]|uniref:TPR repeat-containing protein n=1 Tax=Thecamonas trahens ATCC 50062 TaxID=461836 RepID=A0A0L0D891_THETB|nr:TPR repeat-containing protein [Thecamonas trahens ATCC 50062]KNC47528.1 TPR repeat-containing protein [Thecamonas trahens ATCC 50062]|eukprot:XP_013759462.1 TPR repeat-containing protein [Thecamonas trahens ATCC 50062]